MEEKCSELEEKAARLKEENARLKAAQSGTMARLIMENSQKDEIIARLKEEVLQKNQEIAQQKAELAQQDKKLEDAIGEALKKEELSDQIQQTLDQTQANLNDTSESYALHVARIYARVPKKEIIKVRKTRIQTLSALTLLILKLKTQKSSTANARLLRKAQILTNAGLLQKRLKSL